jgi:asparagine synthase (glutamine-hydrolysing)
MSAQFGKCNFDGTPIDPRDLEEVRPVLAPYGPDGEGYICQNNFGTLYRALNTTKESQREIQPCVTKSGSIITWDGRIDNREELIAGVGARLSHESPDLEIVAAGYLRWGTGLFRRLMGDWALSIWDPKDRSLILAKDYVGTRHLYYRFSRQQATWCTVLDPLVLFARQSVQIEEEYLAGWLSLFPAAHLTPYAGIHAVPPCSFVCLTEENRSVARYWEFDPVKSIRYRTDPEYEEHFRVAFAQSVRRRLRAGDPVLAELSGGMDSSSIVCMADRVMACRVCQAPQLDTVSYFDDSQPHWNERPYFTQVEQQRGRTGCHIDVSREREFRGESEDPWFPATPANTRPRQAKQQLMAFMERQGNRVVLSGFGGDEVTGGVPLATPELMDLIVRGQFRSLCAQLKRWALEKRKPWLHLLGQAFKGLLPFNLESRAEGIFREPWLRPSFAERNLTALRGYPAKLKPYGGLPSFQENISTLDALRRQLSLDALPLPWPCERRYPYLDRNFVEFLFAIPREQLLRPGQRRSLMRRALAGIVPAAVLARRRKAFLLELSLPGFLSRFLASGNELLIADAGVVDADRFLETTCAVERGTHSASLAFMRVLDLEHWLRHLRNQGILTGLKSEQESSWARTESICMNLPPGHSPAL